jgi:Tfp pilus assembly protein PilX
LPDQHGTGSSDLTERSMNLIDALGGHRNATVIGILLSVIPVVLTILTLLGARQIWPGDRISAIELQQLHLAARQDSMITGSHHSLDSLGNKLASTNSDVSDMMSAKCVEIRMSKDPQYLVTHNLLHFAMRCRQLLDGAQ